MTQPGYWAVLPADVRYDRRLTQSAKLLYAEISSLAQVTGYCWATDRHFADILGCSTKTVSRMICALKEAGYIWCEITANASGPERHIYCGIDPSRGTNGVMDKNDHIPGDMVTDDRKDMDNGDHIPSPIQYKKNNKSITRAREKDELSAQIDLVFTDFAGDDMALLSALRDFAEDRRQRKSPMKTPRAAQMLTKKLDRLSGGDRAVMVLMLEKAVERGWSSVYELKPDEIPRSASTKVEEAPGVIWAEDVPHEYY